MRIAIAQMRVRPQRISLNLADLREYISVARMQDVDVLVCPEMCISGYLLGDSWERHGFLRDIEDAHRALAQICAEQKMQLIFGSLGTTQNKRNEDGRMRKFSAIFVNDKGVYLNNPALGEEFFPKTLSPNYREFDDSRHFFDLRKVWQEKALEDESPGKLSPAKLTSSVTLNNFKLGLSLCEDGWDRDYNFSPLQEQTKQGCEILINSSCSPFTEGKRERRLSIFAEKARTLQRPIIYANCTGTQNVGKTIYGFDGGSLAFSASGELLFEGSFFEEEMAIFEFTKDKDLCFKKRLCIEKKPSLKQDQTKKKDKKDRKFQLNCDSKKLNHITEKLICIEKTTAALCEEWNIQRVVVGLSGGIDSALSAVIFSQVLGASQVYCVNMPSKFNSQRTQSAAQELAQNLGCPYLIAPIEDSINATAAQLKTLSQTPGFEKLQTAGLVFENIQARDRGARLLAALAAGLGGVFSCNANKTEAVVGYSTLYGDLAGFLCPIADLWKHEVYAMAQLYNENIFGYQVIPQSIFDTVPSAELSEQQDVTQGKGDPIIYEYHDFLFRSWTERWDRLCPQDILELYRSGKLEEEIGCKNGLTNKIFPTAKAFVEDLEKWWNCYVGMGAFKRVQAPPIIAVSRRALGFDHRECIGPWNYGARYYELRKEILDTSRKNHAG